MFRAQRGATSFAQGKAGFGMHQGEDVADSLVAVDRDFFRGCQGPPSGLFGKFVHSLEVARLEFNLEDGPSSGRGEVATVRADQPRENRQLVVSRACQSRHREPPAWVLWSGNSSYQDSGELESQIVRRYPPALGESLGFGKLMTNHSQQIVHKFWNHCNVLRDDGLSYGGYVEQLTLLLFLKMAQGNSKGSLVILLGGWVVWALFVLGLGPVWLEGPQTRGKETQRETPPWLTGLSAQC